MMTPEEYRAKFDAGTATVLDRFETIYTSDEDKAVLDLYHAKYKGLDRKTIVGLGQSAESGSVEDRAIELAIDVIEDDQLRALGCKINQRGGIYVSYDENGNVATVEGFDVDEFGID
ncbi:MAG: hypothetical protein LBK55_07545 [Azoarcus sp.]|nr:hypothetical protein [Azoarcus sp.]